MEKILIVHGGAPTAVINASLYGAILEIKKYPNIQHIYGAKNGTAGILFEDFIQLEELSNQDIEYLLSSPASAIGTSRTPLKEPEYKKIVTILIKYAIKYVVFNGGNGSMDSCGKLYKLCKDTGISIMGIPKTIDNDIAITDHAPGYASAARYIATSVAEVAADVSSMPIHVSVIEVMGRNVGWLAAATAFAHDTGYGPDLIYFPERPFDEDVFLKDVKELIDKKQSAVVVASEGLSYADGTPIVEPIFSVGRSTYFGDVSSHLANVIIKKLGYKARGEKPGILGRTSILAQSEIDKKEAIMVGGLACKYAIQGETGKMIGIKRISTMPYQVEYILISVEDVMLHERTLPNEYINTHGNGVTQEFLDWARPLLGKNLKKIANFR